MTDKEVKKELTQEDKLRDMLSNWKDSPSLEKIEEWKLAHGSTFLSILDEDELFIFRPITRAEHRSLNKDISNGLREADTFEDVVVTSCVLWSSLPLNKLSEQKAGTVSSLFEQVMSNSNFIPSVALMNLVVKL